MKSFFLITFFFAVLSIQAKEPSTVYFENNQIRITQQTEDCHDVANGTHRQYVFLQFENLTDKPTSHFISKKSCGITSSVLLVKKNLLNTL
jgi:hypothetical protein